jgi:hypothetical protein
MSLEKDLTAQEKGVGIGQEETEAKTAARITTVEIVEDAPTQETPVRSSRDSKGGFFGSLGGMIKKKPKGEELEHEHSGTTDEVASDVNEPKAHVTRAVQTWMVALDDSEGSEWAFNAAVNDMDKTNERLILITVTPKKLHEEKVSRDILLRHARIAEEVGVQHIEMQLRFGKETGQLICESAKESHVSELVIGPHNKEKGFFERSQSVTKKAGAEKKSFKTLRVVRNEVNLKGETLQSRKLSESTGKEESSEIFEGFQKFFIVNNRMYVVDVTLPQ